MIKIFSQVIGDRTFLIVGNSAIPMNRITYVDFKAPNGSASDNSVRIYTDNDDEEFIWSYDNADAIRMYFTGSVLSK